MTALPDVGGFAAIKHVLSEEYQSEGLCRQRCAAHASSTVTGARA